MKKLSITSISAVLLGMGIFSSPAAWAQTTTTLTFKQNGNAICDTVQLVEDTSGFIRGRQIADNCPNGDYILTGRRNNAQGYVLYTGASGAGMTQLLFNAGGSVEALQLNGTTTPTPSAAWAGVTWGVGTNGVPPVATPTTTSGIGCTLPIGNGNFTATANNVATDFVDLVGATVNVTATDITVSFNVRNLPSTFLFNQKSVKDNAREYGWEVGFDVDNDGLCDYNMALLKFKSNSVEKISTLYEMQSDVWKLSSGSGEIMSPRAQPIIAISGNSIIMNIQKSSNSELLNITPASKIRIWTGYDNGVKAEYDYIQ